MSKHNRNDAETGFTLIELLVVIVIVGILAGIAIPIFLRTTGKGGDATARSDLRNLAVTEESYATSNPTSYATASDLAAAGDRLPISPQDTVYVYTSGPSGYCLVGHATTSGLYMVYDSENGGLLAPRASLAAAQSACTGAGYVAGGVFVNDSSGVHVS